MEGESKTADGLTTAKVYAKLREIHDPEIGAPITEIKLIDQVDIKDGVVAVKFHLTIPYCPPFFAVKIATDIVDAVSTLDGVKSVSLEVSNHYLADKLNKLFAARKSRDATSNSLPVAHA